ncbi:MAG: type IV toxin-antitoxin system AbiEi family antitoxin domain-containing protein [Anaerolineaceae bacterium]|jgi:predicted transcriptional regulator of viral defense system|nr:type IV toxin-antitoxin system AbiEi family antitoxin domain-containing protein [Anaerolineaceae bacterium]
MSLSKAETDFLTTFSSAGKRVFTYQQAVAYWQSKVAATNTLGRLVRKGWLQRLERGLYMIIPLEAGPKRLWSENALLLAGHLISPGAVAYWSALRFWNMTEQIPQIQFIQTTKRKRPLTIQGTEFQFIHVVERYFFGNVTRKIEDTFIMVTDREKTLIDAASRPDLSGGIVQLAQAMKSSMNSIDWNKVEQYLEQWGGGVVAKRLGYLAETLSLPIPDVDSKINRWQNMISKGISQLEPGSGRTGPVITRWQLQINVPIES